MNTLEGSKNIFVINVTNYQKLVRLNQMQSYVLGKKHIRLHYSDQLQICSIPFESGLGKEL